MSLDRGAFLGTLGAVPLLAATGSSATGFRFAHFSDVHIRADMAAPDGVAKAFARINAQNVAFSIAAGDLVYDGLGGDEAHASALFAQYQRAIATLKAPVHNVVGNHDNVGVYESSGVDPSASAFGKGLFERMLGKRFYAFDHDNWHFVVLDSVHINGRDWEARIDDEQLSWLRDDLATVGRLRPIVVATHVPLLSSVLPLFPKSLHVVEGPKYRIVNTAQVLDILWDYDVRAVLQGHSHLPERVEYRGTQFITSGAVCGMWWRGPFLGHPEGFGLIEVASGRLRWEYRASGHIAPAAARAMPVALGGCGCLAGALVTSWG